MPAYLDLSVNCYVVAMSDPRFILGAPGTAFDANFLPHEVLAINWRIQGIAAANGINPDSIVDSIVEGGTL